MRAKTSFLCVFVAAVVITTANCDPDTKTEPGKTADGRSIVEEKTIWFQNVNGKWHNHGENGPKDIGHGPGWSRPETIDLGGKMVTLEIGGRNVTVKLGEVTRTHKTVLVPRFRLFRRSLPPSDGRYGDSPPFPAIKEYRQFRLVPGHTVHMTFEVPLTALLFPSPYYMHMVTGRKCVHLYWMSPERLSYWTTDPTPERPCDPGDGSEELAEKENNSAVPLDAGGRHKREGPPAAVAHADVYYKTDEDLSDGPVDE